MQTDSRILIQCKREAIQSWADHRDWLLDQIEHEFISDYDKVKFNLAVRRAESQIQALHNEIKELEETA